jgi:RNA 2',3'-cyclic 3'-phosphodiesterase
MAPDYSTNTPGELRLFFAVLLPDDMLDAVERVSDGLRAQIGDNGVKWTRREQFHFTLKFLGQVGAPCSHRIIDAAVSTVEDQAPFEVTLGGVGAFPTDARPSTLWLAATAGVGPLTDLALRLEAALAKERFPRDKRPLKPHLTLARVKSYPGEAATAKALRSVQIGEIGSFTVDRIALMCSTLHPYGSEYSVVEEFRFSIDD